MQKLPTVNFSNADIQVRLSKKSVIKQNIINMFEAEDIQLKGLEYIFCSDEYLLKINKQFLKHDFYTDVVTFDLSEAEGGTIGEIYISIERVMENATGLDVPWQNELLRVIFHGALHLCGYGDKTKSEILKIRDQEDHYIRLMQEESPNK